MASLFRRHGNAALRLVVVMGALHGCATPGEFTRDEKIRITEQGGNFVLTVPVSQLVMTVPRKGLRQKNNPVGGTTNNPRYFFFEDPDFNVRLSGWFESEEKFPGMTDFWDQELQTWKETGFPEPQDVSFVKYGEWDAVLWRFQPPYGSNFHIRASWIQDGTWIDLHLSIYSERPLAENRTKLEALLNGISVQEKQE